MIVYSVLNSNVVSSDDDDTQQKRKKMDQNVVWISEQLWTVAMVLVLMFPWGLAMCLMSDRVPAGGCHSRK